MQKVRVYWNLHKKTWSIQDCKSGLVIDHKKCVVLEGNFVVRKGGQKRVRQEGKKNVHAFAVGYVDDKYNVDNIRPRPISDIDWQRVTYNPYKHDYFMLGEDAVSKDWIGTIHMESMHHEHGVASRVYV